MSTEIKIPGIEVKPLPEMVTASSEAFIKGIVGHEKLHYLSRTGITGLLETVDLSWTKNWSEERQEAARLAQEKPTSAVSRFVMALHQAFDQHIPFNISPDVFMMIISQEVAQHVKNNFEQLSLAALFTKTPGEKIKLNVEINNFVYESPDNDWTDGILRFSNLLEKNVPSEIINVMRPDLSISNFETDAAHLISFMDAASKFYSYSMSTCCGIPSFRIEGTTKDWQKILTSVGELKNMIPELTNYFGGLESILTPIKNTVETGKVDQKFWSNIYKIGGGSGGPYSNGWFNNLYAHEYKMSYKTGETKAVLKKEAADWSHIKLNEYPSGISNVAFNWNYHGELFPMALVAGVTAVEMYEGVLTPRLGVAVVEFNPKV